MLLVSMRTFWKRTEHRGKILWYNICNGSNGSNKKLSKESIMSIKSLDEIQKAQQDEVAKVISERWSRTIGEGMESKDPAYEYIWKDYVDEDGKY